MSLTTWKAEFYPCEADSGEAKASPVAHSLRKWEGLTAENLKRHGLKAKHVGARIIDVETTEEFEIMSGSCALCRVHLSRDLECGMCPLYEHQGFACGEKDDESDSPEPDGYGIWLSTGNPSVMIAALNACQEGR